MHKPWRVRGCGPAAYRNGPRRRARRGRGQAARRWYRWCKPPTSGRPTTSPISGDMTGREAGASLLREMRAGAMVVVEVGREKSAEVALTEDDDVVEALAPYRADQSLDEGVLPGRAGRAQDFLDAHAGEAVAEDCAVDPVAVTHDVLRCGGFGERLDDLLGGPGGGRMFGHV